MIFSCVMVCSPMESLEEQLKKAQAGVAGLRAEAIFTSWRETDKSAAAYHSGLDVFGEKLRIATDLVAELERYIFARNSYARSNLQVKSPTPGDYKEEILGPLPTIAGRKRVGRTIASGKPRV